jgi:hypothetical protein
LANSISYEAVHYAVLVCYTTNAIKYYENQYNIHCILVVFM